MKRLQMLFLLTIVFYCIYPQALDVYGSSFIVPSGIIGLGLFCWHRFPFREVVYVLIAFGISLLWFLLATYLNGMPDTFIESYLRSQMAWFFTSYLIIFLLFKIHGRPTIYTLIGYIIAAVFVQCVITVGMYLNEGVKAFFYSLQMKVVFTEEMIAAAEQERLIGYGAGLFGAGMVCGYALIFMMYVFAKVKMNVQQLMMLAAVYSFIFYIGLFSARTTVIGLIMGLILFVVIYFSDKKIDKKQVRSFLLVGAGFFVVGYSLSLAYFPEFTDWAFELFINFRSTGKAETQSSNSLIYMAYALTEYTLHTFLIGQGSMIFFGNDMGYVRLIFYSGIPGVIFFFGYQMFVAKFSMTKDKSLNILVITIVLYVMVLNIKGQTDINTLLYLFFFYFMFYKYYIFYPQAKSQDAIARNNALK